MKKIIFALCVLFASTAFGATTVPIQLINPTGSSAGQAIVSTGASSPPSWGGIGVSSLAAQAANTVVANVTGSSASPTAFAMPSCSTSNSALQYTSGTGFTCFTSSATTGANTFTGSQTIANSSPIFNFNATSGTTLGTLNFQASGSNSWQIQPSTSSFVLGRYVAGTFTDSPIIVSNATGVTTFTQRPVFGSATPWDSANLNFATPPAIGATTPSTGKFTTLQTTSAITPSTTAGIVGTTLADNATAGSVGETITSTVLVGSAVSISNGVAANVTSITLTAGDWDVWGSVYFHPAASTVCPTYGGAVSTTSASLGTSPNNGAQFFWAASVPAGAGDFGGPVGKTRINVSTTTTVFLVAYSTFTTSTNAAYGFIGARRVR